jgi:hypothetical protein
MDTITIPTKPPRALLVSMAMRLDHAFGMPKTEIFPGVTQGYTDQEREVRLGEMEQVYEEVAGTGFYKWDGSRDGFYLKS